MGSAYAHPLPARRVPRSAAFTSIRLYVAAFVALAAFGGAGAATALLMPRSSSPANTAVTPIVTTAQP